MMRGRSSTILRAALCALLLGVPTLAQEVRRGASRRAARAVLVPIDDRPATTQFTEMIGAIGDVEVLTPPREALGVFYTGGRPEKIAEWLRGLDYRGVDAVILSTDMLAYGGLMTSRTPATPLDVARRRLEIFGELRRRNPRLPVYAFNVVQRVALSATAANRAYRDKLARWAVLAEQAEKQTDPKLRQEFERLGRELPPGAVEDYLAARRRNLEINFAMLDLVKAGAVNELLLLQDDAQPYGLHRLDQARLRERIGALGLTDEQAKLYNGADEGSSVLLSRAALRKHGFTPRVRVVFSSEAGRKAVGIFEDHPIEVSVERQASGSGARLAPGGAAADYTLYVNAPAQTEDDFRKFLASLVADIKAGRPVAIADVLFPNHTGGSDPRLIEALGRERLLDRVAGYASWNTPGNTLGTVIPQANMYALAGRFNSGDPERAARSAAAHAAFLLHRYVGDYGYHSLVRPEVNRHARGQLKLEVDELDAETYATINATVAERVEQVTRRIFAEHFKGRTYGLGRGGGPSPGALIEDLRGLKVRLPWMRTFEVRVDFELEWSPAVSSSASEERGRR